MKHETAKSRSRFSLVAKLNFQLWIGQLGTFILIDLILVLGLFSLFFVYGEHLAGSAAKFNYNQEWLIHNNVELNTDLAYARGIKIPTYFQKHFPIETVNGKRRLAIDLDPNLSYNERLNSLRYIIEFENDANNYGLYIGFGYLANIGFWLITVLMIIQGLLLIRGIFIRSQLIREALQPLSGLAEKARSINTSKGPFTPEEMKALAGKLDDINAEHLDVRIEVGETQDELRNLATSINGMLDRINASYRAQARFVSDASHELRTPIAAIQGYANLLDRWGKYDENALQESIDAIKAETASMKDLIEQLLFLARGDNNTMQLQITDFDFACLGEIVYKESKMIDSGHDFTGNFNSVMVRADQGLIKQAIRILVDNAIKYTPVGGNISLTVVEYDNYAKLTVQDEGIGIPTESVPQIFDRFYRAEESRARTTGGTGLGLSIAKWIVDHHGGYMEVLSREDLGTRISLVLPKIKILQNEESG